MKNLDHFLDALRMSWDVDTAASSAKSAGSGKPHGQCAVTALLVQDHFGGELLRAEIELYDAGGYKTGERESHYWNLIPAIGELDFTREQYPHTLPIPRGVEVPRSRLLEGERAIAARTPERYKLLADRVRIDIRSNHDPDWT